MLISFLLSLFCSLPQAPKTPVQTPQKLPIISAPVPALPMVQQLGVSGILTPQQQKNSVRLLVNGRGFREALPGLWAGVTVTGEETKRQDWEERTARMAKAGATLIRFAPLSEPDILSVSVKGEPRVRWEIADTALLRVAQKGVTPVLVVKAPPPIALKGWSDLMTSLVKRYAGEARFRVLRWEFEGTGAQAKIFYPSFARAVRQNHPNAPVGMSFLDAVTPTLLKQFSSQCVSQKIPLDAIGLQMDAEDLALLPNFARLRSALSGKGLPNLQLYPELVISSRRFSPRLFSVLTRLGAMAPSDSKNGLLGFSVRGADLEIERNLAFLNRTKGLKLDMSGGSGAIQGLTTRNRTSVQTLLWNEGAEGFTLLKWQNIASALPSGTQRVRMRIFQPDHLDKPIAELDFKPLETVFHLLLLSKSALLLEFRAAPSVASPVELALVFPKLSYRTGENLSLLVTVLNPGSTSKTGKLQLSGLPTGLVPKEIAERPLTLEPKAVRAFRFNLLSPIEVKPGYLALTIAYGESKSAILLKQEASFSIRLLTPRVVVSPTNGKGEATLRLTNNSPVNLPIIVQSGAERVETTLPSGKQPVEVRVPFQARALDPGFSFVPIEVLCYGEIAERFTVNVAVPVAAHYRDSRVSLGNLIGGSEWRGTDPFGAGRAEQVRGGKGWKGPGDLSFMAYAEWNNEALTLIFDVADDRQVSPPLSLFEKGDSLFLTLSTEANPERILTGELASVLKGGNVSRLKIGGQLLSSKQGTTAITLRKTGVRYAVRFIWKTLEIEKPEIGTLLRIGVRVHDVDVVGGASNDISLTSDGSLFSLRLEK